MAAAPTLGRLCRKTFFDPAAHAALLAAVSLAIGAFGERQAYAQRYWSTWRAQNPRQELIDSLRAEQAMAKKILAAAESQALESQTELDEAVQMLTTIRKHLEDARADSRAANEALREIEKEIVESQKPDSELGRTQAAYNHANAELQRIVRRVTGVNDPVKVPPEKKELLNRDVSYLLAKKRVSETARQVQQARQKLFQADDRWQAARKDQQEAQKAAKEGRKQATTAGLGSLSDKQKLRNAKQVAAMARTVIALTEFRLRQIDPTPNRVGLSPRKSPGEE